MTWIDAAFGIGCCGALGFAVSFAIEWARSAAAARRLDRAGERWHERHSEVRDELLALQEEVMELACVLHDAQLRWGFDMGRWPRVADLVGDPSLGAISRFLIELAPGIRALRESGRATDRFAA